MKRIYADLHLKIEPKKSSFLPLIPKISELGYKFIGIPLPPNIDSASISKLKQVAKKSGLDFVTRVDIKPKNSHELLSQLRKFRRKFEIICVICENKDVARQAAKDRRVDLLNFPKIDYRNRFFDKAQAELASNSLSTLEIDIYPLIALQGSLRVRLINTLRREIELAQKYDLPLVLSSGVINPIFLRKPLEVAALASLLSLPQLNSLDAISTNPLKLVKRNREKLSQNFIAPGIRLIKQGEDC